ncbi:MAG: hypothetical protein COT88_00360, partial [Candidatus Colwellbacteria bacterium CG10_big_fil_rev_8_21_14_0_10_41_28]
MKTQNIKSNKGFTLIEMLIVIAIVAILAGIVIAGISNFRGGAVDAKKISELRSAQNLIELYYAKCGVYPGDANCGASDITFGTTGYTTMKANMEGAQVSGLPDNTAGGDMESLTYGSSGGQSYTIGVTLSGPNQVLNTSGEIDTT